MLYVRKSFSVSSVTSKQSGPRGAMCLEKGHSGTDSLGRCYCCGEKVQTVALETVTGSTPAPCEFARVAERQGAPSISSLLAGVTREYLDCG
jgi:hypothetical protein